MVRGVLSVIQFIFCRVETPFTESFNHQLLCYIPKRIHFFTRVATKVLPLSDTIRAGTPLVELNLLKLRIKVEADKSGMRSKCMALVMQHVYSATHTFDCAKNESGRTG